jgi:hypothetical protein
MALSLTGANIVKQKALAETRRPHVQGTLKWMFSYLAQHKKSPDLQFVPFEALADTDVVIADAACRIYALYVSVLSTSDAVTYVKMTDSATASSDAASEFRLEVGGAGAAQDCFVWHNGAPMASGVAMQGNTTANGGTGSDAADGCSGFVILGAP